MSNSTDGMLMHPSSVDNTCKLVHIRRKWKWSECKNAY